jgi:hypothetical protein
MVDFPDEKPMKITIGKLQFEGTMTQLDFLLYEKEAEHSRLQDLIYYAEEIKEQCNE